MEFKHDITEQTRVVERTERWSAEIGDWNVFVTEDEHSGASVTVYQRGANRIRVGLVQLRPENVGELERFADVAGDLLRQVADGLRQLGRDDLRGKLERQFDDISKSFAAARSRTDKS